MNLLCCCTKIMAPNTRVTRKWELFAGRNRFYCDGILMSAPHTGVFYLTCFLITGTSALFFAFDCPYLAIRITPAIPIVGALLYFFTMSSLLRTTFTDPGIIPRASNDEAAYIEKQIEVPNSLNSPTYRPPPRTKEVLVKGQVVKLKYCFTCKIFRPPRASHCSLCDNCVDRFDHHCPWVGNCVGKRNYRFFYMFLVSLAFLAVFIFSCSITHLVLLMKIDQDIFEVIKKAPFSVIVTFICFFSIWSVIGLAGFHTYLTTSDQTTNEDLKGSFSSKSGQRTINPYSHGNICLNCFHILCGPMTPSLIDRRGIVTDEFILQMQHHSPNNQLMEVTTQQSGMIIHQPMIESSGAGDMKPRLYDETNPTLLKYRHRSYDNLHRSYGNSNSLAHLVDNEIPLSTLDADSTTIIQTSSTMSPIINGPQANSFDDDNIGGTIITTNITNSNNLSGSYNNLFRDNLDNSFAENISGSSAAINGGGGGNDCLNEQINLTTLPQSITMHEFQQHQIIVDDAALTTLSRRMRMQKSASESENVYSNVPNSNMNSTTITATVAPTTTTPKSTTVIATSLLNPLNVSTRLAISSDDDDSNKSDPSLHVYSNLIEERQNQQQQQLQLQLQHLPHNQQLVTKQHQPSVHQQQQQQQHQHQPSVHQQQLQQQQQQQQPQQQHYHVENKQSHLEIVLSNSLIKPHEIKIQSSVNKSNSNLAVKRNSKHDDFIKSNDDDPSNLMSSTLLSDDLDLDDPVSAFVVNTRNRKYQNQNQTNSNNLNLLKSGQNRKNSESDKDGGGGSGVSGSGKLNIGSSNNLSHHHHHHPHHHQHNNNNNNNNSNSNNNLSKDSNVSSSRLKLLHDTTMIDTALDLDSLDGSSISQTCLVKTAIV